MEYIDDAPISIKRESFEEVLCRQDGLSSAALALFSAEEREKLYKRLFAITCHFHRCDRGIAAIKRVRLHTKLAAFEASIRSNSTRHSEEFTRLINKWGNSERAWERNYAQTLLGQPDSMRLKLTNAWLRENRFQLALPGTLTRKRIKQQFTVNLELYLRPLLQKKTSNGRALGEKKQRSYLNALIGATMLAAGEHFTSTYSKYHEDARLRQQRSRSLIQQRPGPDEMSDEEVAEHVQVGQRYIHKKQKLAPPKKLR